MSEQPKTAPGYRQINTNCCATCDHLNETGYDSYQCAKYPDVAYDNDWKHRANFEETDMEYRWYICDDYKD